MEAKPAAKSAASPEAGGARSGPALQDVMAELAALGSAQNRKVYGRHGAGENQFGVSFANLKALRGRIKTDHALAVELWQTGNSDARILATMIADPGKLSARSAEAWLAQCRYYVLVDALVTNLIAKTGFALSKLASWTASADEWKGRAGWMLLADLAIHDTTLADDLFVGYLRIIEKQIHRRANRTREAMNYALIAIGLRGKVLKERALATAAAIGPIRVDHGETSCRTPAAAAYIQKGWERKQAKKSAGA